MRRFYEIFFATLLANLIVASVVMLFLVMLWDKKFR